MALLEDGTAVFIVRVWREHGDAETSANTLSPEWRGSVEHLQSGQRTFFRTLEAVSEFMKTHLEKLGIDPQQRFWERISSAMEDASEASSASQSDTVEPTHLPRSKAARKRR